MQVEECHIREMIIKKAEIQDISRIMDFIRDNWNEGHILARDRHFFEWMYTDQDGCNFIIAEDETGQIYGIEGVVKYNSSECPDIAGTIWKVIKSDNPLLGMDIGKKMYEVYRARCDVGPGVNRKAMRINQMLGYLGAPLEHYYILGKCEEYKIAIVDKVQKRQNIKGEKKFVFLKSPIEVAGIIDDDLQRSKIPYKDLNYIIHRYMEHPVYHYEMIGIQDKEGRIRSIVVGREVSYEGARVYKIIDYLGHFEDLIGTAACFYKLLDERRYEFIDLYCYGVPKDILKKAGFSERAEDNHVVIPNYFSPFERKNVDIYFVSSKSEGLNVFRGDGDQDRPS